MRLLVCGGRNYSDYPALCDALDNIAARHKVERLISGCAPGADTLAEDWAADRPNGIPVDRFPADWKAHGKAAGPMRNQRMIDEGKPDMIVAFEGGRGTADMIRRAKKAKLHVLEIG